MVFVLYVDIVLITSKSAISVTDPELVISLTNKFIDKLLVFASSISILKLSLSLLLILLIKRKYSILSLSFNFNILF